MKFEKFLKDCGTHGRLYIRDNGDKWLICGKVGMKVPNGIDNLLGSGKIDSESNKLIEALIKADTDDRVSLTNARIPKDGKASDIIRIFSDEELIEIGITNSNFGLLEKTDTKLAGVSVDYDTYTEQYLLILNYDNEVVGFIGEN